MIPRLLEWTASKCLILAALVRMHYGAPEDWHQAAHNLHNACVCGEENAVAWYTTMHPRTEVKS